MEFLGNLRIAKNMILSAKKGGADVVKFQIWDPKFLKRELGIKTAGEKFTKKLF